MNRAIKPEDLTQTVALYAPPHGTIIVSQMLDYVEDDPGWIRLTEPLEITFIALSDDDIPSQNEMERASIQGKIDKLERRLLAITHDEVKS